MKSSDFDLNPEIQAKWLPRKIRIKIEDNNQVSVVSVDELKEHMKTGIEKSNRCAEYEIAGVVAFVKDLENEEKCNLVSILQVDDPYLQRAKQERGKTGWFIFNDFW